MDLNQWDPQHLQADPKWGEWSGSGGIAKLPANSILGKHKYLKRTPGKVFSIMIPFCSIVVTCGLLWC
jgi:hypothetical protein